MPLYEYECSECGNRFERIQSVASAPVADCPECGGPVRRLLGIPALQFKGTGWYVTDYGKGNGDRPGSGKNGSEEKHETKAESAKTDKTSSEKKEKPAEKKAANA